MYCIKLSILPYQLFMFNDFNDLETFRASDKRTSSDFNKFLKYLNIFKITSSNNGYHPSSPKTAIFVVLLPTPRENLQNLICTFSCFMFHIYQTGYFINSVVFWNSWFAIGVAHVALFLKF